MVAIKYVFLSFKERPRCRTCARDLEVMFRFNAFNRIVLDVVSARNQSMKKSRVVIPLLFNTFSLDGVETCIVTCSKCLVFVPTSEELFLFFFFSFIALLFVVCTIDCCLSFALSIIRVSCDGFLRYEYLESKEFSV